MAEDAGRWGWHRLDSRWTSRLARAAAVRPGDLVLDIGAGTGAITARLVEYGAKVVAIELHPARAAALRERFEGRPVVVVRADAGDLRLPRRPFKVVANLPFGITTAVLRRLTSGGSRLDAASVVVPVWAAARWVEDRGAGRRAATRRFSYRWGGRVPAAAFRPPPPGDAAILLIGSRSAR